MSQSSRAKEFDRLHRDFERKASEYPDLSLSVYYLGDDDSLEDLQLSLPNHVIVLWQFMGSISQRTDVEQFSFEYTTFGLTDAKITAYGVVQGQQTDDFRRMANRAGSLIPDSIRHSMNSTILNNLGGLRESGKPLFVANFDAMATWLNFVLSMISTFQPERFRNQKLAVDPYTASLAALDHLHELRRGKERNEDPDIELPLVKKRFRVALTFAGEQRAFVENVARGLQERLNSENVFYDRFFEAELARPNMDVVLQQIYHANSDLVVIFLSQEYETKEWCGLEWRAVRDLIKKREDGRVMPMRFSDVELPGLFSVDGYIDLKGRSPEDAIELILKRLRTVSSR